MERLARAFTIGVVLVLVVGLAGPVAATSTHEPLGETGAIHGIDVADEVVIEERRADRGGPDEIVIEVPERVIETLREKLINDREGNGGIDIGLKTKA